jgi:predicted DNA binding CopG/RHH family protein
MAPKSKKPKQQGMPEDLRIRRLAKLLENMPPERVKMLMAKSARINLRVTEHEKQEIASTAKALGLTVTEYLTKCHGLVSGRLREL